MDILSLTRGNVSFRLVHFRMVYCGQSAFLCGHVDELAFGLYHPPFAQTGGYPSYRYVTSANYLGEIIEWAGWAILTCSLSGLVFFWWTVANLVPRANAIWHRYREEFGSEVGERKRVFPFIY